MSAYLRDVDQKARIRDIGNTDEALLDDPLALDLHAGNGGPWSEEQRRRSRAGVRADVVNLLGRHRNGLIQMDTWEDQMGGRQEKGRGE